MDNFYDQLAPLYHLIYQDWEASIARQAQQLSEIIHHRWGSETKSVLDVSCGIGTQSLGLAALGFRVTGSDLSPGAIARAKQEAENRGLNVAFSICDMRQLESHHPAGFDVVLSADNSLPHLLSNEEILVALQSMYSRLHVGGGCVITLRDYDQLERGCRIVKPYGIRDAGDKRYLIWQVWDFEGDQYALSMYFVEDDKRIGMAKTQVMRSRYYAISPDSVLKLMSEAGFVNLERLDESYFQSVLVGTKKG